MGMSLESMQLWELYEAKVYASAYGDHDAAAFWDAAIDQRIALICSTAATDNVSLNHQEF
ncbi:hypothetical protein [Pseudoxanthomonas winnipegensis]|uniref:hypothetical protein n=1 Tax=Pseudoxanthomonas winnipegensis TaxID=2480810 RepID=UPI00102DF450|nr:hypothetical protein [Pseudoxanthomonas winnipegensis]TAA08844.1 hypothetical protein EA659_13415 [Pseudoxanthomonas winnipegensis]TAH71802.1 hypothetical protein EA657_11810 [Pseudoxanthomonas winnipegensis]